MRQSACPLSGPRIHTASNQAADRENGRLRIKGAAMRMTADRNFDWVAAPSRPAGTALVEFEPRGSCHQPRRCHRRQFM